MEAAQDFLGEVSGSVLGGVVNALAKRDVPALFGEVEKLMSSGRDLLQFTKELAARMRDIYVVAAVPCATDVVSARGADFEALRSEAAAFGSVDRLSRILTVLGDASSEMRTATNQRLVLEIAFTRIARPEADLTLDALADRVAYLEHELETLKKSGLPAAVPSQPAPTPQVNQGAPATVPAMAPSAPAPAAPVQPAAAPQAVAQPVVPAATPVADRPLGASPSASRVASGARSAERRAAGGNPQRPAGATEPAAAPARPAMTDPAELQRTWKRVVDNLVHEAPSKGSLLMSSSPVSDDGEKLVVSLPKGSRFAAKMLERADVRETVDGCVRVAFGYRQLVFVESSMANKAIANADRAAAASAPRPAASASAPAPVPVAPRPALAPAPAAPQPAAPAYDAPWDDVPPYTDNDAAAHAPEDAGQPTSPAIPPAGVPVTAPLQSVSPAKGTSLGASRAASEPQGERRAAGGSPFGGASASDPAPFSPSDQPEPAAGVVEDVSSHPEFSDIASMLTEAFGMPLSMSVEPAVTTSDDDAAAELSYDDNGVDEDPGFADEPEDDADAED